MVEIKLFPPRREINIISYNIHSGLNKNMFPTLFDTIDFLKQSNADIICLYVFKGKEIEKRMINNIAKEIILRINGMYTFDDIVKYFSQKYETSI